MIDEKIFRAISSVRMTIKPVGLSTRNDVADKVEKEALNNIIEKLEKQELRNQLEYLKKLTGNENTDYAVWRIANKVLIAYNKLGK